MVRHPPPFNPLPPADDGRPAARMHTLAQRRPSRKISPFEAPAYDNDRRPPHRIAVVEGSALKQRNSHRGKVSRRHRTAFEGRLLVERVTLHFDQTDRFATAQRNMVDGRCLLHTRHWSGSGQQRVEEFVLSLWLVVSPVELNAHRNRSEERRVGK